jgi:O-antigen ligase
MVRVQRISFSKIPKILVFGTIAVTLIMTPGLNKDSLIIPKVIILFCLALFMLPIIFSIIKDLISSNDIKKLVILTSIIFLNGILILINSPSPIDQLLFGRTGRGLGFLTFASLLIIILSSAIFFRFQDISLILKGVVFAGLFTSTYSCIQYFGFDIFKWDSKTNGIIGTLGNPNSQSSFAAMIFIPTLVMFWKSKYRWLVLLLALPILLFTLYISQSTQGYIGLILAVIIFGLIFFWYRSKIIFIWLSLLTLTTGVLAIFGMLGHGPLTYYLYKVSVQSRGDFWRSAFTTGNENPLFGVGFDSFGDYSLKYRDEIAAAHSFAEYTDSAHNFYLDYLATGGYPFLLLNIILTLFVLRAFYLLQRKYGSFNKYIAGLFCAWLVIQLQSIVNTQTISFLTWNALISGAAIGIYGSLPSSVQDSSGLNHRSDKKNLSITQNLLFVIVGIIIMFSFFNTDRLMIKAGNTGNGDLLIQAATSFPQSVTKYSQASRALLDSGLPAPALYLAQKAVEFNPNAVSLWALILINPSASLEDRQASKERILELDPLNKEVKNFIIK